MPGPIQYKPIGVVHSPFTDVKGMPIQPSRAAGIKGTVKIYEPFVEGLCDLEGFSHVILLYHLHQIDGYSLKVVPFLDTVERGLFATRAPCRPNPIGLSVVKLMEVNGDQLSVEGVDILDGTPLLDIKPYVGEFDERGEARFGWLEGARNKRKVSDDRFE